MQARHVRAEIDQQLARPLGARDFQPAGERYFLRCAFSLTESDETRRGAIPREGTRRSVHASATAHVPSANGRQAPVWLLDDAPIMGGAEAFALRPVLVGSTTSTPSAGRGSSAPQTASWRAGAGARHRGGGDRYPLRWAAGTAAARACGACGGCCAARPPATLLVANTARAQAYAILAARTLGGSPQAGVTDARAGQRAARRGPLGAATLGSVAAVGDAGVKTTATRCPAWRSPTSRTSLTPDELAHAVAARLAGPRRRAAHRRRALADVRRQGHRRAHRRAGRRARRGRSCESRPPFQDAAYHRRGPRPDRGARPRLACVAARECRRYPGVRRGRRCDPSSRDGHGGTADGRARGAGPRPPGDSSGATSGSRDTRACRCGATRAPASSLPRWPLSSAPAPSAAELTERFDPAVVLETLEHAARR